MMAKAKNTLAYSSDATVYEKKTFATALTLKLLGFTSIGRKTFVRQTFGQQSRKRVWPSN